MRFIDISLYLDKLKERLSLAFSGKLIPDRLSNFFDLNTKNALPKSVADKINEQIGAILLDKKTSDTGLVYRKQGNSLSFAEMYFSAAATGHEEIAIKAIVKNLIDWVIDYHDLVSLCKLDRKKISKILLQYLHYRLGHLDETQIDKDTRNHFRLFEECFENRKKIT